MLKLMARGLLAMSVAMLSVEVAAASAPETAFMNYCDGSARLTTGPRKHTLDALLKAFHVNSCQQLYVKMSSDEYVSAAGLGLVDITLFAYLPQVKRLDLSRNQISDLAALAAADQLQSVFLQQNKITDLRPLLAMKSLRSVNAYGNPLQRESVQCPIDTHIDDINRVCFDVASFDRQFAAQAQDQTPSPATLQAIIQQVINFPGLDIYYHVDVLPERSPLRLTLNHTLTTEELGLEKFNVPVMVADQASKMNLQLKLSVRGPLAKVSFDYPPEGVFGEFKVKQIEGDWRIMKSRIYE